MISCVHSADIYWVPTACHHRERDASGDAAERCAGMTLGGGRVPAALSLRPGNASLARGRLSGDLTQNSLLPLASQVPREHPGLGLTSPHHSLLHHSAPGTLAFLLFLKPAKLVPTSEPFRFPFLLPGNLFLQISARPASSPHSGLCSDVRSSGRCRPAPPPS